MASVVTYWRLPDEEGQFLDYLEKTGDIQACVHGSVSRRDGLRPRPLRDLLQTDEFEDILFGPQEFMAQSWIDSVVHEGRTLYSRSYRQGPLICYTRGGFRTPQQLAQSNLCFVSSCWVSDGANPDLDHSQPQPPEFLAWAKNVLSWVRRHTQPHGYYRATPRVLAEVENGLELVT